MDMHSLTDHVLEKPQSLQVSHPGRYLNQDISPATLHNRSSPIGRLPIEILVLIFQEFVSESGSHDILALFLLGSVCSDWRNVCLGTPTMWVSPHFMRCNSPALNREVMLDVLSRSAPLPISMTLDMMCPLDELPDAPDAVFDYEPIWHIRDRLQHFVLTLESNDITTHAPCMPAFPLLASLDITLDEGKGQLDALVKFFADSPSLRTFSLYLRQATFNPNIPKLPWDQLTTLTLSVRMDDVVFYEILQACPLLEECTLANVGDGYTLDMLPVLTMHALRSLDFTPAEDSFGCLLKHLSLPRLESLTLSWDGDDALFDPVDMILQLHERAPFQLFHLNLNALDTQTGDLVTLLRRLGPSLRTLALADMDRCTPGPDSIFSFFTCNSPAHAHSGLRLPHLTRFVLQHDSDEIEGSALVGMIDSLWAQRGDASAPFPSLRSVELHLEGSAFDAVEEEYLLRMVDESDGFLEDWGVRQWDIAEPKIQ